MIKNQPFRHLYETFITDFFLIITIVKRSIDNISEG